MKKLLIALLVVVLMMGVLSACSGGGVDNDPCADACGLTAPHGDVVQDVINWVQETDPQGGANDW